MERFYIQKIHVESQTSMENSTRIAKLDLCCTVPTILRPLYRDRFFEKFMHSLSRKFSRLFKMSGWSYPPSSFKVFVATEGFPEIFIFGPKDAVELLNFGRDRRAAKPL